MTITIKREGLKLSLIGGDFPARGSSDVPIQLQSDGSYSGYMITPQFGWYQNGAWKEAAAHMMTASSSRRRCIGRLDIAISLWPSHRREMPVM